MQKLKTAHNYLILLFNTILKFTFYSFQGPQSWYLILLRFFLSKRWSYFWNNVCLWGSYVLKQKIMIKNLKIISIYLILLFYHHFLVTFLVILRYIKMVFHYIVVFLGFEVRFSVKSVCYWYIYGLKQGNYLLTFKNHSQLPNITIYIIIFRFAFSFVQVP